MTILTPHDFKPTGKNVFQVCTRCGAMANGDHRANASCDPDALTAPVEGEVAEAAKWVRSSGTQIRSEIREALGRPYCVTESAGGKMTQTQADEEIAIFVAILKDYDA